LTRGVKFDKTRKVDGGRPSMRTHSGATGVKIRSYRRQTVDGLDVITRNPPAFTIADHSPSSDGECGAIDNRL